MASFSSAEEKQGNLFNGDNEEDKRKSSFGDGKTGGCCTVDSNDDKWRFFLFPAKGFWTWMSHIPSQGEDV